MLIAIKSPIASIIGKAIHNALRDNVDRAVITTGVRKTASPTPKIVIPTNKNQNPAKTIKNIANNREINIRKNIPFEKKNTKIRLITAIKKAKSNPISKISLTPLKAKAK